MKKTYIAPLAEELRFMTCDVMGPSYVLGGDTGVSGGGDDHTTDLLPLNVFNNP